MRVYGLKLKEVLNLRKRAFDMLTEQISNILTFENGEELKAMTNKEIEAEAKKMYNVS